MKAELKARLKKLSAALGDTAIPESFCVMLDGKKKTLYGFEALEPALSGDIREIRTEDKDIYNLFKSLCMEETTVIYTGPQ